MRTALRLSAVTGPPPASRARPSSWPLSRHWATAIQLIPWYTVGGLALAFLLLVFAGATDRCASFAG